MDEWSGETHSPCGTDSAAPLGAKKSSGSRILPLLLVSLGLQGILLWPFHFTVAEDGISKALCGNQVAVTLWLRGDTWISC